MAWNNNDRVKLARILSLEDSQYYQGSCLSVLMDWRTIIDNDTGSTFVADIQKLITKLAQAEQADDALTATVQSQVSDPGLIELTLVGQTKKRYDKDLLLWESSANSPSSQIIKYTNQIKRLLDPQNHLAKYTVAPRIIPT